MNSKIQESTQKKDFENLSKYELIGALENSRMETFKYVNKFLELEEKWAFINILLKRLNSIRQKQELCRTICDGFLKLTNSKVCFCCLFNQDNSTVENRKISHQDNVSTIDLEKFIEKINSECSKFLERAFKADDIFEYFNSISGGQSIIVPILYSQKFLGYLMLIKEDENFYNENIHFINIFPEHIALILENISLYQESEKQNKRKIEFLAGISHEFKTPLNSIIGFAEIIESQCHNLDNNRHVKNILQSANHLLTLIKDILDVSKSQYKILELNYSVFSTKDEITKVIQTFDEMFKEKDITLNYTLTEVRISADIKRFRQLIYNLLSNAIKFNKKKGKINILTYISNDKFFVEVTDTGDGISKRNYDKIFDFFSQVNRSQLKRQLGSGVGLAICKMITDAHKGEINFKSQIKKGSSFWFSLPLNH